MIQYIRIKYFITSSTKSTKCPYNIGIHYFDVYLLIIITLKDTIECLYAVHVLNIIQIIIILYKYQLYPKLMND